MVDGVTKQSFDCEHCAKSFTQKTDLDGHTCPELVRFRVEVKLIELETRNKFLQARNKDLQSQLKTANAQLKRNARKMANLALVGMNKTTMAVTNKTQILNNLVPITSEHLREQAQFLTLDHVRNGIDGVAQFAVNKTPDVAHATQYKAAP